MAYEIESDVPMPEGLGERRRKYPFRDMQVGDSFVIETADRETVRTAAYHWGRNNGGKKFAVHVNGAGARIWRVS